MSKTTTKKSPKSPETAGLLWQDQADAELRGVLTSALGREPDHDIKFNRNAIQSGGRGSGRVTLYSVASKRSTAGANYGAIQRGLIHVASEVAALVEEEAFHVKPLNFVATLVALHVECDLVAANGEDNRKGLTRSPNDAHIAALAAAGVRPVMRKRNKAGHKAMVACEPVDASEPRWDEAVKAMDALNAKYGGNLGEDEDGVSRTAADVAADVIEREREMRKRNDERKAAKDADKAAGIVKMPAMKAAKPSLDAFLKAAKEQGVDIEDPAALGEVACGAVVLAYAGTTETPKAKSA